MHQPTVGGREQWEEILYKTDLYLTKTFVVGKVILL